MPSKEVPTDNEFDKESHAASDSDQDVAPSNSEDNNYEVEPRPLKAKAPAAKKPKRGKVLYDDIQNACGGLNGHGSGGQVTNRQITADLYSLLLTLYLLLHSSMLTNITSLLLPDRLTARSKARTVGFVQCTRLLRPAQSANRVSVAPKPADIEVRSGGVVDDEGDEDEEEEHVHAKKTGATGKIIRTTSQVSTLSFSFICCCVECLSWPTILQ